MNIQQRIYEDAQKASGLQVGDWVRVIDCGLKDGDKWTCGTICWNSLKQNMIDTVFNISNIDESGIWNYNLCFPYFALEKLSYAEAQEASGLKVGDRVKVTRKAKQLENGWENNWDDPMSKNLDKIGIIKDIDSYRGIEVLILDGENKGYYKGYYYPYFILEKVSAPKPENKEHEFKPFDKVLVRNSKGEVWKPDIFLYIHKEMILDNEYRCAGGLWEKCIPYEGNEHLVGTTDMPE